MRRLLVLFCAALLIAAALPAAAQVDLPVLGYDEAVTVSLTPGAAAFLTVPLEPGRHSIITLTSNRETFIFGELFAPGTDPDAVRDPAVSAEGLFSTFTGSLYGGSAGLGPLNVTEGGDYLLRLETSEADPLTVTVAMRSFTPTPVAIGASATFDFTADQSEAWAVFDTGLYERFDVLLTGGDIDTNLELYDPASTPTFAVDPDGGAGRNAEIIGSIPMAAGTRYARVFRQNPADTSTGLVTLNVSANPIPELTMEPQRIALELQTLPVFLLRAEAGLDYLIQLTPDPESAPETPFNLAVTGAPGTDRVLVIGALGTEQFLYSFTAGADGVYLITPSGAPGGSLFLSGGQVFRG